jgi:hypothetical protein
MEEIKKLMDQVRAEIERMAGGEFDENDMKVIADKIKLLQKDFYLVNYGLASDLNGKLKSLKEGYSELVEELKAMQLKSS